MITFKRIRTASFIFSLGMVALMVILTLVNVATLGGSAFLPGMAHVALWFGIAALWSGTFPERH